MQFLRRRLFILLRSGFSETYKSVVFPKAYTKSFSLINKYSTGAFLFSLSWFESKVEPHTISHEHQMSLISQADHLYKDNKYREVYSLLREHKDSNDVEILWRLSRAQYNLSQEFATSDEEKRFLIFDAYQTIQRSLSINDKHFANHKWMSILLDSKSTYEGIKSRISKLEAVKKHMLKATELNPKDATTLYMLGLWCYQITDMPWYQRKIATMIFASPPHSSYDEALHYFTKAEEAEPRFYSHNLLMLGKTYMKLDKIDKAKYYLDLACNYPVTNDDDQMATHEACELLAKLSKGKKK